MIAGNPRLGRGDLDHQVRALDPAPELLGLRDRGVRVTGEVGRHLHRHEAVGAIGVAVHAGEQLARVAYVVDHERPVGVLGGDVAELAKLLVVIGARAHCLLEDRRVRRDAADAVVLEQLAQAAARKRAREVVVPGALAELDQCGDVGSLGHLVSPVQRASSARACATTLSALMPRFSSATLPGADAPNRSMPTDASA